MSEAVDLPTVGEFDRDLGGMVIKITEGGWIVAVVPMIYNDRIILCTPSGWRRVWTAGWCYDKGIAAFLAASAWNPDEEPAPVGYKKIAGDGRVDLWYCPACKKPAYEPRDDCHDF